MSEKFQGVTEPAISSKVTIERLYDTSTNDMWEMWTTKQGFESWWPPEGFRAEVHTIEACVNGKLRYDMIAYAPEVVDFLTERGLPIFHLERCYFSKFRTLEQLEIKMTMDYVPDVEPYESTILVEISPVGEQMRMVLTLDPMHNEEFTNICAETLVRQLANLEKQLNNAAA